MNLQMKIIKSEIKSSGIIYTDECRIVLFQKVILKINIIRINENEKKYSYLWSK